MDKNYQAILDLIGDIYESATTPGHWSVVIEKLATITRSMSGVLVVHDREMKQLRYQHSYGIPKLALALHNSPLGKLDPGLKVMRAQPPGKAVNMYSLDDKEKIPKLIYELITRLTDMYYFGGVNCYNDEYLHAGIGLHRSREEGEFEPETLELIESLVPHIQRALRIQKEFTRLQMRQKMLQSELDRHIIGLILLGENNEPVYLNPMAERILERHGAIELRNNRLHAYSNEEDKPLQQAIIRAALSSANAIPESQALGLNHPDHNLPLALLVVSADEQFETDTFGSGSQVAIYVTDPEKSLPIADETLMSTYGLTEREASIAVALTNGRELSEIAEIHHVSVQTVRTQLKNIFHKTGVNRQADLIRLLLSSPLLYAHQASVIKTDEKISA